MGVNESSGLGADGKNKYGNEKRLSDYGSAVLEQSEDNLVNLKRTVGLAGGISLIAGSMIGSGIFVTPGGVLKNTESVSIALIVWAICGLLSILGGITYIELSTVVPSSGAEYSYILSAFGSIPGFMTSWASVLMIKPTSTAAIALSFSQYCMGPFIDDLDEVPWAVTLVTIAVIYLLTFANALSTNLGSRIQIVFTVAKLLALTVVIGSGIYNLAQGQTENLKPDFEKTNKNFGKIATAFYSGVFTYDGWNQLNFVTEEIQNPYRNLPRAILIAIPLVTFCYIMVNIAFLTALSPAEIAASTSVANDYGIKVLGVMSWLMPLSVALSAFGSANGGLFTSARVAHVAGREGHLPELLCYVNVHRNTPTTSLVLTAIIATFLILAFDIHGLIQFHSFTNWIFYAATAVAMITFRYTRPDAPRPFKAPIWVAGLVVIMAAFLVIVPVALDPQMEYLYSTAFIVGSLALYVPFVYKGLKVPGMDYFTWTVQKILQVIPPEGLDEDILIRMKPQKTK